MKTFDEMAEESEKVYFELRAGRLEMPVAAELNNSIGKWSKIQQLKLAREIFEDHLRSKLPTSASPSPRIKRLAKDSRQ